MEREDEVNGGFNLVDEAERIAVETEHEHYLGLCKKAAREIRCRCSSCVRFHNQEIIRAWDETERLDPRGKVDEEEEIIKKMDQPKATKKRRKND